MASNRACPSCRSKGRDKKGDHLFLMEDKHTWYCSRCGYIEKEDSSKGESVVEKQQKYDDPLALPSMALPDRKIRKETCDKYGVKVSLSEANGEIDSHYYPVYKDGVLSGWKKRGLPKSFASIGDSKGAIYLFGQNVTPQAGKRLLITGGELDCLAAYQMLYDKYPTFEPSVVSLPKGENVTAIADNLDYVNSFEEVLIYTDMDDPGRKCAKDICDLLGPKAKLVLTSEKDASDMLVKGKAKEFINAFFTAKPYTPDGFVTVEDVYEEATAMPTWGKSWPWPTLTKLTYGRRLGEGAYFGAGVKVGKSEAVNQIAHHITQVEKGKIALFKLEEKPSMTVRKIAGKIMHKQFHIPDGDFTQAELVEGVEQVKGGVVLYDSYGATSWDKLKAAIRHAVVVEGCQDIVIDPLTRLTTGMNSADANTELERVADEISKMAKDLGFFYMFFCHLKAPQTGKAHEEGGRVHSNQFTGSRAMMRACYYMLGIERDKTQDDEIARNTSSFVLLEDRAFGNSGRFDVFYNRATGDYLEPTGLGFSY
jgi:twinkle protein